MPKPVTNTDYNHWGYPSRVVYKVLNNVTVDKDGCWISNFSVTNSGYTQVSWSVGRKQFQSTGHQISCRAAHGPKPFPEAQVRHKCHKRKCVNPKCLQWGTAKKNAQDRIDCGSQARGEKQGLSKVTGTEVMTMIQRVESGESRRSVAKEYGISHTALRQMLNGVTWSHVTGRVHPSRRQDRRHQ